MKRFEKNDLFKITGLMVLLTAVLTWLIPYGYFSGGELVKQEITRIGLFDFFTYGLLGLYYFTVLVTFLLVLCGFYQLLAKIPAYQNLTSSIAKKLKGKEILFATVISFIIAAITSFATEYFVILAFVPFIITICSKLKMDKLSTFATSFGGILVGIMGSLYNSKIVGINVSSLGLEYQNNLVARIVLFALTFIIFTVFNILHMRKTVKAKNSEVAEDLFVEETNTKDKKAKWPLVTVLTIVALTLVLAYIPWATAFNLEWPTNALTWIQEVTIFDHAIFSYILGNVQAFGEWDIFGIQVVLLIATLILKVIYKVSFDDVLESYGEGFKKSGKLVVIMLLVYIVLEFSVMFPVLPTISNWFLNLTDGFNVVTSYIVGLINSLFTVEFQYTSSLISTQLATLYAENLNVLSVIMQSTYGLVSFFAPTSAILLIGLSYLDIKYKSWLKYIWKFLVVMLIVTIIMAFIIA